MAYHRDFIDLTGKKLTAARSYTLLKMIGAGGMAQVYQAIETGKTVNYAVKVLSTSLAHTGTYAARFQEEANNLARLKDPHIIPVEDYGTSDVRITNRLQNAVRRSVLADHTPTRLAVSFIVMPLLTGGTLQQRLDYAPELPSLGEVSDFLMQIGAALDYAHASGVLHRDVTPANLMFDAGVPYLVDFGIAKGQEVMIDRTGPHQVIGAPKYMAPERWTDNQALPASDQYALAVVVYQMLTGRLPFHVPDEESQSATAWKTAHDSHFMTLPEQYRSEIPADLSDVLEKALAKKPEDRYPTITEFALAFRQAIEGHHGDPTHFFIFTVPDAPTTLSYTTGLRGLVPGRRTRTFSTQGDIGMIPPARSLAAGSGYRRPQRRFLRIGLPLALIVLLALVAFGVFISRNATSGAAVSLLPSATPIASSSPTLARMIIETYTPPPVALLVTAPSTALATANVITAIPTSAVTAAVTAPATAEAISMLPSTVPNAAPTITALPPSPSAVLVIAAAATLPATRIQIATATLTVTATASAKATNTVTSTATLTASATLTLTASATATLTATATPTAIPPSATSTPTFTSTWTATPTATLTPSPSPTPSVTPLPTRTPLNVADLSAGSRQVDVKGLPQRWVPAGCFTMGSDPKTDRMAQANEQPAHKVCLTGFWIDEHVVTNADYAQFVQAGGYTTQSYWSTVGWQWLQSHPTPISPETNMSGSQQPHANISWYEAEAYAAWRGGHLPTEAQWEYAARGTGSPNPPIYPWGDTYAVANTVDRDSGLTHTDVVCNKPSGNSWVRACDMAGNVWEWTADWYDPKYYAQNGLSGATDPAGPAQGTSRTARGGAYNSASEAVRSASRQGFPPETQSSIIGFRIVTAP